jgi:hypothetical protein
MTRAGAEYVALLQPVRLLAHAPPRPVAVRPAAGGGRGEGLVMRSLVVLHDARSGAKRSLSDVLGGFLL